jgi:hypothetical protein
VTSVSGSRILAEVIDNYPLYQGFLREDAVKHIIAITDDDSSISAAEFQAQIASLPSPGFSSGIVFHSIVDTGLVSPPPPPPWPPTLAGTCGEEGTEFISLSNSTGGLIESLEPVWTVNPAPVLNCFNPAGSLSRIVEQIVAMR